MLLLCGFGWEVLGSMGAGVRGFWVDERTDSEVMAS